MKRLEAVTGHTRLARRGAVYYHRAAIPVDIKDSYPKAGEVFSLKTKDYAEALRKVRLAAVEVDQRFAEHRQKIALERAEVLEDLTPAQIFAAKTAYHRIAKYADLAHPCFAGNGVHINRIESFWSTATRRHQKFNGLRQRTFPVFVKLTEFRFSTRNRDLYKILLRSCRMKPLRR